MVSVQHLLDRCPHRTTIVFGNLGRWPDRVTYYESRLKILSRGSSRQVWEAPQNTEAYPLDLMHCTRLEDVTWLVDWEMHRDENLPWRVPNHGNGLWKPMWNARIRTLWPMGCPLTSSSIYKASCPSFSHKAPCNPFILLMPTSPGKPVPIELSIATIPSDGSDPQVITGNHAGLTSTPREHECLCLVHAPLPKPREYLPFCVRGKLSQMGRGFLMVVKGTEQQKFSQNWLPCPWRRSLNSMPFTMEPFPTLCTRKCTRTFRIAPSYQFAKYLQQFNKLQAEWSHKVSIF
ncbi:hypothetical protein TNCV_3652141 [Trichonephila clavipes]|uniref:Uncharacterized protein n=1 Tax=Trichonephila clavipes TaxID=2585209 RepID=A0A8X6V6A0_TRICX|nr:hypothetical protein TNCV_3652141 [Trichonephila clavipes]